MDPDAYRTLDRPVRVRTQERRSVFECRLERADDETAARAVVQAARGEHPGAGHHCWALVVGRDPVVQRSGDDGEPSGTAGAPMLEALLAAPAGDVVAVVSRWFGGVLLGTGGLSRAYGGAVRAALEQATWVQRVPVRLVTVEVGHDLAGRLEHDLRARGVDVRGTDHGALVRVHLAVPTGDLEEVAGAVAALTSGRGRWQVGPATFADRAV